MKRMLGVLVILVVGVGFADNILTNETILRQATDIELQDIRIGRNQEYVLCVNGTNHTDRLMVLRNDGNWYVKPNPSYSSVTVDMSKAVGSWVAMTPEPFTNTIVLHRSYYHGVRGFPYILSTNAYVGATNYSVDSVECMIENGTLTNVIRRLAEEGYICEVLGHVWSTEPVYTWEYGLDTIGCRKCGICGKVQRQRVGVWE